MLGLVLEISAQILVYFVLLHDIFMDPFIFLIEEVEDVLIFSEKMAKNTLFPEQWLNIIIHLTPVIADTLSGRFGVFNSKSP